MTRFTSAPSGAILTSRLAEASVADPRRFSPERMAEQQSKRRKMASRLGPELVDAAQRALEDLEAEWSASNFDLRRLSVMLDGPVLREFLLSFLIEIESSQAE